MTREASVTETLEAMIDKHGLTHVLVGLSLICSEKADHIETNWQDKVTARAWIADSKAIEQVARRVRSDG